MISKTRIYNYKMTPWVYGPRFLYPHKCTKAGYRYQMDSTKRYSETVILLIQIYVKALIYKNQSVSTGL